MSGRRDVSILSVQNDANDQDLLRRAFRKAGYGDALRTVSSVAEARRELEGAESLPCALLLDLKLRGESGLDFLRWIRAHAREGIRRLRVLLLTSSAEEGDIERSYDLGATAFFVKPSDFEELLTLARSLVEHWGLLNRLPERT